MSWNSWGNEETKAGGMRSPHSLPASLTAQQQRAFANAGIGRGRGIFANMGTMLQPGQLSEPQPHSLPMPLGGGAGPAYLPAQPQEQAQPTKKKVVELPEGVPQILVDSFLKGTKNPISALMEFAAITKVKVEFKECAVRVRTGAAKFANECTVDGKLYPQGTGTTKKEAKTKAASLAFRAVLGIDENVPFTVVAPSKLDALYGEPAAAAIPGLPSANQPPGAEQFQKSQFEPPEREEEKHPVMRLQEHCQKRRVPVEFHIDDEMGPYGFECKVWVDGRLLATAVVKNKKEAKKKCAENALKVIFADTKPEMASAEETHYDRISHLANRKYDELTRFTPEYMTAKKTLAAFVVKIGGEDEGRVVALGTGQYCVNPKAVGPDGRTIKDVHAEVIARRALLKYLYGELGQLFEGKTESLFEMIPGTRKARLKGHVSFHLYISTAPCGDGSTFIAREHIHQVITEEESEYIHQDQHWPIKGHRSYGLLHKKCIPDPQINPGREVTRAVEETVRFPSSGGDIRLPIMSCSDKILKWDVLGLQGALLSHIVEPVYLSSITLGDRFDHGHLVRALCCRVEDRLSDQLLAAGLGAYQLRHPFVGRVSLYRPDDLPDAFPHDSINWCAADGATEIVTSLTGKATPRSPFKTCEALHSRLCKAAFMFRFRNLCRAAGLQQSAAGQAETYYHAKQAAREYQQAKELLKKHLEEQEYGSWLEPSKEQELFQK